MVVQIRDQGFSIGEVDVSQFEKEIGVDLPKDYRDFLIKNNGGRPDPKFFQIVGFGKNLFGQIQDFFGIRDPVISCELLWNFKTYRNRIGPDLLAIACEDGGNLVCMRIKDPFKGEIVYWDFHVASPCLGAGIYKVSGSFECFLEGLQNIDPLGEGG